MYQFGVIWGSSDGAVKSAAYPQFRMEVTAASHPGSGSCLGIWWALVWRRCHFLFSVDLDAQARAVDSEMPLDMDTTVVSHTMSLCFSLNSSGGGSGGGSGRGEK